MLTRLVLWAALAAAVIAVGACGSSDNNKKSSSDTGALSAAQYRQALHDVSRQESRAQASVQKALHAPSVGRLVTLMNNFAADQQAVSTRLGQLEPPSDARAANTALATAFADNASALHALIPRLQTSKSPRQALTVLGRAKGARDAGRQIDAALTKLKQLGYTQGS